MKKNFENIVFTALVIFAVLLILFLSLTACNAPKNDSKKDSCQEYIIRCKVVTHKNGYLHVSNADSVFKLTDHFHENKGLFNAVVGHNVTIYYGKCLMPNGKMIEIIDSIKLK